MAKKEEDLVEYHDIFSTFLNGLVHQWLKTLAFLGIGLVPIFGILDYFIAPDPSLVTRFWMYRAITTVIILIQYFVIRYTKPGPYSFIHGYINSAVLSISIVQMTVDLGGFNASYYQGLNLVIIAINLLIPWKFIHSAINGTLTMALYIGLNLMSGASYEYKTFISNLFFMSSTVIIAVAINYLRYNLIEKEFQGRLDLKKARDALRGEMEIAKKIQTSLLPAKLNLKDYEVSAIMVPADEVGGDYYDVIETKNGDTWIAIGDVSGHGVESGLIMMMTSTSIYSLVNQSEKFMPSAVLDKVNYVIKENIQRLKVNRYVTLTILKMETNHVHHSGKHQDILVYRAATGKVEAHLSHGTWIGITNDLSSFLRDEKIEMFKNDVILLFTDGLTEAENAKGEMYSDERLIDLFEKNADQPVKVIIDNIMSDVTTFQHIQNDDITLLVCRKL